MTSSRSRALSTLGPDLLAPAFDRDEALARLAGAGPRPIAEVLLDQRVVAGIGNVFKSEVLFLCGIHPDRLASTLAPDDFGRIVDVAVPLMRANTGAAASSGIVTHRGLRRTTRQASGEENLWVYRRGGKPCRTLRLADRVGQARHRRALHLLVPDVSAARVALAAERSPCG